MIESERPPHDPAKGSECECFNCHIHGGLTIGLPRDLSSRTRSKGSPRESRSSYNAGIPVSHRPNGTVMPYLRSDGNPMHQREFDQKSRQIKENRAKIEQSAQSAST